MDAASNGRRHRRNTVVMRVYGIASLVLIGLYPVLSRVWGAVEVVAVFVGAAVCIGTGRRMVVPGRRRTWTLLLVALAVFVAANLVLLSMNPGAGSAGRFIDAIGYLLLLAAALALIIRRGPGDLGGVIDAAVIAFAVGSVLWVILPHRLGPDASVAAQVDLFVVVFALTGVLGALLRLATIATDPGMALWWLLGAIGLVISGSVVLSMAGSSPALNDGAIMLQMAALTALGLFGLDVSASRLVQPEAEQYERLSAARLVFLGVALAVGPVVVGARDLHRGDAIGMLLAVQGVLLAALVIGRIGLLAAQRTRAEQALQDQATHDPLTHLPNRRQFVDHLRNELDGEARCVLLFCDLDGFKAINDRLGHDAGDSVLIEVANRLRTWVGPPHVVSRFGGDEFAALLLNTTSEQAQALRACVEATMGRPFEQAGGAAVGISIGVAVADGERDPEKLIKVADAAMYQEKASHAGRRSTTA